VCTHNSARSQMAEGLVHALYGGSFKAYSAGTVKTEVKKLTIAAMANVDIDISHHRSQHIDEYMDQQFDLVVTVCDLAKETCPYFPNTASQKHVSFKDPSIVIGNYQDRLEAFIRTRKEIEIALPEILDL